MYEVVYFVIRKVILCRYNVFIINYDIEKVLIKCFLF